MRHDLVCVIQPLDAGSRLEAEAQVAAAAGEIERELGLVAAVDAERGIEAVEADG